MNLSFATVLFAAIIAALIATPAPVPLPDRTVPSAHSGQLAAQQAGSPCAQQNWPNYDAACLRYVNGKQSPRQIRSLADQG